MSKFSISKHIILFVGLAILLGAFLVSAQEEPFDNLTYPISELGNCQSRDDCKGYCEQDKNIEACLDYAESHGLLSQEEINMGRQMLVGAISGPGGCSSKTECEAYCDNIEHIEECIIFAEEHNLIPEAELEEAHKVIAAIKGGLMPPPCKGKRECDVYCSRPENMEVCIEFAIAAGIMPSDEAEDAQKMLRAVKQGLQPPKCNGKEECDIYCAKPDHMQECMEFAIAAGFMPPEEVENAQKMLKALKQGIEPPNCQGEEECEAYCAKPDHMAECMEFAIAAGFMPEEEIENAKKMLKAIQQGIKPPNCRGEEECEAYCAKPDHMAECLEFSIAAGFMPEKDIEQAKKTLQAIKQGVMPPNCRGEEECQTYCSTPEHTEECINFAVAMGQMTAEEAEQIRQGGGAQGGMTQGGPGGCQGEEECGAYCQNPANARECIQAGVDSGHISQEEAEEMLRGMEMMETMEQQGGEMMPSSQGEMMPYSEPMPKMQEGEMMPEGQIIGPEQIMGPPLEGIEAMQQQETEKIMEQMMPGLEPTQSPTMLGEPVPSQEQVMPQAPMPQPEPTMPKPAPEPEPEPEPAQGEPQSLLTPIQSFLANLLSAFGF